MAEEMAFSNVLSLGICQVPKPRQGMWTPLLSSNLSLKASNTVVLLYFYDLEPLRGMFQLKSLNEDAVKLLDKNPKRRHLKEISLLLLKAKFGSLLIYVKDLLV